jgi:tetratricopeptide (TPR) repeat protein
MKAGIALAVVVLAPPLGYGEAPTLATARQRWLRGDYADARAVYESASKDAASKDAAALGVSKTWQSQGDYDRSLAVIEDALRTSPKQPVLLARRADLLLLRGRWDEAEEACAACLAAQPGQFLARWVRASILKGRGRLKEAESEFRWFVRTYTARNDADKDIKDPDELLLVGRAGCENAQWNNLSDQFQFILTDVYGDALKYEKDFWPAEYRAGMLLLEKYNRPDALAAFDKALALNPRAAEALVGKGIAALQQYEIQDAKRFADRALAINPHLPEALCLRADLYLALGEVGKALETLERARKISPREEIILGRIAGCFELQNRKDQRDGVVEQVEKQDAKPATFYLVFADQLAERRRFLEAETCYKKATQLWPMMAGPQANLGLLYMRMGRETEARPLLERAFGRDSFNVRVANMLKVLRHLDQYETIRTAHFELRFDPALDRQLARYMSRYLEVTYADLSSKFHCSLSQRVLFEVFNDHEMFSGRTIALPDLHTIGACTGRMVAMASPHAKGIHRPFNWARVVRHEMVHVFNLEQTNFQVPHWYTEGLAVGYEGFSRPSEWSRLLVERLANGGLLDLDTIDLSFIRPQSSVEWSLAYCQSQLYVEYLEKKFGHDVISQLLEAFRQGLGTSAAILQVCKVDKGTFERGYRQYLDEIMKPLDAKARAAPRALAELQTAHEKDPQDVDTTAALAEQYLFRRRTREARRLAEAVLAEKKSHALASYVKARLLQLAGDDDQAKAVLEAVPRDRDPEPKVLLALGRIYFESGDFAKAAEMFELGRRAEPYENRWLLELARTYSQSGDIGRRISVLKDVISNDGDDINSRKQLARLLLDNGRAAESQDVARQALEIDVIDPEACHILGDALLGQRKFSEAADVYRTALELDGRSDDARVKLATALLESGNRPEAFIEVQKVLAGNPENSDAKRLHERLSRPGG